MKRSGRNLIVWALWFLLVVAVLVGFKSFTIWEQVVELHAQKRSLANLYAARHPHFLRYLVAYPVFLGSNLTGLSSAAIFNLACLALLPALALILRRVELIETSENSSEARITAHTIVLFSISYFMNGRIIFALFGYSILVLVLSEYFSSCRWRFSSFILCLVGILFCSVSSGVFAVAFLFLLLCLLLSVVRAFEAPTVRPAQLGMTVSIIVLFAMFREFLLIGIDKNIEFYGGGIEAVWTMLDHGLGTYLTVIDPSLVLLMVPMLALAGYAGAHVVRRSTATNRVAVLALCSALAGGIFGLSTLSVGLVPALLVRPGPIARIIGRSLKAPAAQV